MSSDTAPGSAAGTELSLSLGKQPQQQAPQRGVSAPSSPAKSRESLLQRVQSLTGAAREQIGMLTLSIKLLLIKHFIETFLYESKVPLYNKLHNEHKYLIRIVA